MPDLEKLLERLVQHQVEFVVIGGYAAVAHGASYVTFDLDVCCPFIGGNLEKIHAALIDLHPYYRETPQELPFTLKPDLASRLNNLYLKTDLGQLDCLGSLPEIGDYAFAAAHSVPVELPFGLCRFLDCPTLIRVKETVRRPKDLLVASHLRAILEATSDQ
jgi:hypothetical protein